jgi:hypothetical protein
MGRRWQSGTAGGMWNLSGSLYSTPAQTVMADGFQLRRAILLAILFLRTIESGRKPSTGTFHEMLVPQTHLFNKLVVHVIQHVGEALGIRPSVVLTSHEWHSAHTNCISRPKNMAPRACIARWTIFTGCSEPTRPLSSIFTNLHNVYFTTIRGNNSKTS